MLVLTPRVTFIVLGAVTTCPVDHFITPRLFSPSIQTVLKICLVLEEKLTRVYESAINTNSSSNDSSSKALILVVP